MKDLENDFPFQKLKQELVKMFNQELKIKKNKYEAAIERIIKSKMVKESRSKQIEVILKLNKAGFSVRQIENSLVTLGFKYPYKKSAINQRIQESMGVYSRIKKYEIEELNQILCEEISKNNYC